jgi:hypothetical protein
MMPMARYRNPAIALVRALTVNRLLNAGTRSGTRNCSTPAFTCSPCLVQGLVGCHGSCAQLIGTGHKKSKSIEDSEPEEQQEDIARDSLAPFKPGVWEEPTLD